MIGSTWTIAAKAIMREKGITKASVAERLGYTPGALTHWFNGRSEPKLEEIKALADVLGVSFAYLVTGGEVDTARNEQERELLRLFRQIPEGRASKALQMLRSVAEVLEDKN